MKAIIKRELKNYLKNPIFWIGLLLVIAGTYQCLKPYLKIHYFKSDQEIQSIKNSSEGDAYVSEGWVPYTPEQHRKVWNEKIVSSLTDFFMDGQRAQHVVEEMKEMDIQQACLYLEETYGYYGAQVLYQYYSYHQGTMQEVNQYLEQKMAEHSFSYYFSKKFADFAGLYMAFFATFFLAFLFMQDTKKNTYELLHTKPLKAWQYVLGKITGGYLVMLLVLGILNLVYLVLCIIDTKGSGFVINPLDFIAATCMYILPNMLMIVCVYTIISLVFKNPLPAVPLLILYMVYSNMGSRDAEGVFGYYGRTLAIMVRFPGEFFDTAPPPMALFNQTSLLIASALIILFAIYIWKRRRVY